MGWAFVSHPAPYPDGRALSRVWGMLDVLASSPLLTMFLVVGFGAVLGAVRFGPLRFGAAGALFVGLALGALDPRFGEGLVLVQSLGLALFVYTVGLAAGTSFFRDLRTQGRMIGIAVVVLLAAAGVGLGLGRILGLDVALQAGSYAGALTSTPALAAATTAAGNNEPAVGYSLGYPVGVVITIVVISLTVHRRWPSPRDPAAGDPITATTVEVEHATMMREIPGWGEQSVRFSYLCRNERQRVVVPGEELLPGDRVVVVGQPGAIDAAEQHLGHRIDAHLADDRSIVGFRRFLVSNREVAGRTIRELNVPDRFGGVITRVMRADSELLATDELVLELGDRVLAVVPRDQMEAVSEYFGDSVRKVSEIDALSIGVGMALGLLLGLVTVPLPGGNSFALGTAAGPLLVGLLLGRLERTGPIVWGLPHAANLTIRQLGLLLFLAAVGLSSGQAFASEAFSMTGLRIIALSLAIAVVTAALFLTATRLAGFSAQRSSGALAGLVGQPAILAYATSQSTDPRIDAGYAPLFALGMITKIVLVTVLAA